MSTVPSGLNIPSSYLIARFKFDQKRIDHALKSGFINTECSNELRAHVASDAGLGFGDVSGPCKHASVVESAENNSPEEDAGRNILSSSDSVDHFWLCVVLSFVSDHYCELDEPAKRLDRALDFIKPYDHPLELRLALIAARGNPEVFDRLASANLTKADIALRKLLARALLGICPEGKA